MARIRSIHPEACTSERLANVSAEAERCYWRLQTHCDDEGRCQDHPRLIWAALFPLHESVGPDDVDRWLTELADWGLVVRYEADGGAYLCVTQWERFQHPQRPKPSKFPAPPDTARVPVRDSSATTPVLVLPGEGEGEGVGEGDRRGNAAPAVRARDELWDSIIACWNIDEAQLTQNERGRLNKVARLLRDVDAEPSEIPRRRARYRLRYPDAADTPMAVAGRWSELRSDNNGQAAKLPAGADMTARNLERMRREAAQ